MAAGLLALLDDVAVIAKIAAASIDDVAGAASKAGVKAVGVVVDDTAVTPRYAMGFTPDRELPIVAKIAAGSLRNKFLFLLPGALLLSAFAPWAVTPVLMLGGAYLCYEAGETIFEALSGRHEDVEEDAADLALGSAELEARQVQGAVRTDMILSAEITAIALVSVADRPLLVQAAALAVVGLLITIGVYGVVALIVKLDDIGLHLARKPSPSAQRFGCALVHAMPGVLTVLGSAGTAAMLWVGGGILMHGLHTFGLDALPGLVDRLAEPVGRIPALGAVASWIVHAVASAALGLAVGAAIVAATLLVLRVRRRVRGA